MITYPSSIAYLAAAAAALCGGAVYGQDSESATAVEEIDIDVSELDRCAAVPRSANTAVRTGITGVAVPAREVGISRQFIDMAVLDDRHIYLRTRGSNHYLFTLEQCDDLYKAYLRQEASLVPIGRAICQNDGSYVLYIHKGRDEICDITLVQRVESRAEAREIAANLGSLVTAEPVETDPQPDDSALDE